MEDLMVASNKFWHRTVRDGKDYTEFLIDIVKEERYQVLLDDRSQSLSKIWEMIADEMTNAGAPIPVDKKEDAGVKCHQKWVNLQKMFISSIKHMEKLGERKWTVPKHFDAIKDLMFAKYKGTF